VHEAPAHDDIDFLVVTTEGDTPTPEASTRIKKFIPKPRKVGTGFVTKPGRNTGDRPTPRERRPFTRESNRPDRPTFTKPWEEEKASRLAAAQSPSNVQDEADATPRPKTSRPYDRKPAFDRKPSFDRAGKRPPFGSKPSFGNKPRFSGDRPAFKTDRPSFRRNEGSADSRPPRREFTPRPYSDDSTSERPRKTFSKPGTFGRKREGFAGKPSFSRESDSRPPRRDFGDRPDKPSFKDSRKPGSFAPRPQRDKRSFDERSSGFAPRKPYAARESRESFDRPSRSGTGKPSFTRDRDDRKSRGTYGDRPKRSEGRSEGPPFRKFDAPRKPRPFSSDRPEGSARPTRTEGSTGYAGAPKKTFSAKTSFGAKKPYSKSTGGYAAKSSSSYTKKSSSFTGKPHAKSAAGRTGKPASTFDKFKGNKKPFGKRAPARKFKPEEGESAG
jgi:hypothetical protein